MTLCRPDSPWAQISRADEAEIRMLAVEPDAWGRGVGRRLVDHVMATLRAEGRRRLTLVVLEQNSPAQRFYLRLGFTRAPDRDWRPQPGLLLVGYALDV